MTQLLQPRPASLLPPLSPAVRYGSLPDLLDAETTPLALLRWAFQTRELPFVAVAQCGFPALLGSVICQGERVMLKTDQDHAGWTVHAGDRLIMNGPWLNLNALLGLFSATARQSCDLLDLHLQALGLLALGLDLCGEEAVNLHGQPYPVLNVPTTQGESEHFLLTAQGRVCYALEHQGAWTFNLTLAALSIHTQLPAPQSTQGESSCSDAKIQSPLQNQWPGQTPLPWPPKSKPSAAAT